MSKHTEGAFAVPPIRWNCRVVWLYKDYSHSLFLWVVQSLPWSDQQQLHEHGISCNPTKACRGIDVRRIINYCSDCMLVIWSDVIGCCCIQLYSSTERFAISNTICAWKYGNMLVSSWKRLLRAVYLYLGSWVEGVKDFRPIRLLRKQASLVVPYKCITQPPSTFDFSAVCSSTATKQRTLHDKLIMKGKRMKVHM